MGGSDTELNIDQDENKKMKPIKPLDMFKPLHWDMLCQSVACNVPDKCGATDKGMVDLLERASINITDLQAKHKVLDKDEKIRFPFSSNRKRMSTIIQNATGSGDYDRRLLIKGASEIVLKCCTSYLDANG